MANEKRLSLSFAVIKNGLNHSMTASINGDLSGDNQVSTVQSIGTSWEALTLTDLASTELIAIRNLDATNFVEVAVEAAGANKFAKLGISTSPTSVCYFAPAGGVTIYAKADTGACNVQVVAVEP